jgi:hypothetical protein
MALTHDEQSGSPGLSPFDSFGLLELGGLLALYLVPFVLFVEGRVITLLSWLYGLNETAPLSCFTSGAACFLLAVLVGAYRQFCIYLLSRTAAVQVIDDQGREQTVYLGTYCPVWLSVRHRLLSWLLVATTSLWAAGVMAATPILPPTPNPSDPATLVGMIVFTLALRWVVSAVLGWGLAAYGLYREQKCLGEDDPQPANATVGGGGSER